MTDLFKFLQDNWQWLAAILISFLSFLVHLIQKRPVARNLKDWCDFIVTNYLPQQIINAEKLSPCSGETKKADVLEHAINTLGLFIKLSDSDKDFAVDVFSRAIENILATPRKKGN